MGPEGFLSQALAVMAIAHLASALFFDHAEGVSRKRIKRQDGAEVLQIPLRNFGNRQYTIHIEMSKPAVWFNFTLTNTHGYTAVAGVGCDGCSQDPHEGQYNSATSSSYQAPLAGAQNITFKVNGKTCTGQKAKENCGFLQETNNGTEWWKYDDQSVVVASNGSSTGVFGTSAGIAGMGYSGVEIGADSIVGKYLAMKDDPARTFTYAVSLYGLGITAASNGAKLAGDSSGGYMHLGAPDPAFYSGEIETIPVAGLETSVNWSAAPDQVGSFDWTVQTQGWLLKAQNSQGEVTVTGGQGMYATMEAGYPYILFPQADASKIYSAIPGAQTYIVPTGATGADGLPVYDDPLALSWSVPCTTTDVAMYMNFNGTSIPIQPSDLWTTIGGACVGNIKGWADPTRTTAIMGSAFFRNAYVVFTAAQNPAQNTVGIAARVNASQEHKNTKIIIGSVVGGVAFLALLGFGVFILARYLKGRRTAPSAEFAFSGVDQTTTGSRTMTALSLDAEKSPGTGSSFFGSRLSHGRNGGLDSPNYIAEPWLPPPNSSPVGNGGQQVMVQPWTPAEATEQAFLAPTGASAELPYQPRGTPPTPSSHRPTVYSGTGAPISAHAQSSSGHSSTNTAAPNFPKAGHQRPMSQVSWVSATSQPPQSAAISGQFTTPPPRGSTTSPIMQVHPPGAGAVRRLPTVPDDNRNSNAM